MPELLWLILGLIIGAPIGFLFCCILVAAGESAARYHDGSHVS